MVPSSNIAAIIADLALAVLLPLGLAIRYRRTRKARAASFFAGCGAFLFFAMGLEQGVHALVGGTAAGAAISASPLLFALYGGFMAALFEETGRFVFMRLLLKKHSGNDGDALMFGAGHGGIECILVLGSAMLNNLIYAKVINAGAADILLMTLPESSREAFAASLDSLVTTPAWLFCMGGLERISAVILHIALSVLVWLALTRGIKKYWFLALFFHFYTDAATALLNSSGVPVPLMELMILAMSLAAAFYARTLWRRHGCGDRREKEGAEDGESGTAPGMKASEQAADDAVAGEGRKQGDPPGGPLREQPPDL